ncbi:hypothetical protein GYH30_042865 [Glycine max]|nr:hypothetical protein GYH30_042865 [Glycine max]
MKGKVSNVLAIVFFLVLISQGFNQCFLSDVSIRQSRIGNLILNFKGFQSIEHINPSLLTVSSDLCLVNADQPIYKSVIKFKYVWDYRFLLNPFPQTNIIVL